MNAGDNHVIYCVVISMSNKERIAPIFIIGPSMSGKSRLAMNIASAMNSDVVDIGLICRMTADQKEGQRLKQGALSSRGDKGDDWVSDIVDRAVKNYKRLIIVGYPRTMSQFTYLLSKYPSRLLVAHLATHTTSEQNMQEYCTREDITKDSMDAKSRDFYRLLASIFPSVGIFTTATMTDEEMVGLVTARIAAMPEELKPSVEIIDEKHGTNT